MKLSIIVPVYNMAADGKLNFCLDSLVNQTIDDYEIIAVDDASTDNSPEILKEYVKKYPGKVKALYHKVNKRQGGAKNTGLDAAVGQWIGFIDSDDWVTPDYYEKLLHRAEETGADMVGCDYSLVSEHGFTVGEVIHNNNATQTGVLDEEKHKSLIMRPGSMVIKIYKHDVIREHHLRFPEAIFYEDNCAGPLWSLYFTHFERVEEPMYFYYQHNTSTVHTVTKERCYDRMRAADLMLEGFKKSGQYERYEQEINYRYTELYYGVTLFSYMLGCKWPEYGFVKELGKGICKTLPEYDQNPYYQERTNPEEKEMMALQKKSDLAFYLYYGLKVQVRRFKKNGISKTAVKRAVCAAAAVLLAAILALCFCLWLNRKDRMEAQVLFLGDSIFGQYRDETSIPAVYSDRTGQQVINGAFGGSTLARINREHTDGERLDHLSFAALATSIALDDFGPQQTVLLRNTIIHDFPSYVDVLDHLDYDSLQVLFVEYGNNDYLTGVPIRTKDPRDPYSFEGALRSGLEQLKKAYPDLRIILVTPTYFWIISSGETCESADFGGGLLEDYVNAMMAVAREQGVECIDLYHGFFDPSHPYEEYTTDGLHPNEATRARYGAYLADYLKQ